MVALYITSMEAAGKTALCAGIVRKLLDRGAKVGFLMPVQLFEASDTNGCEDVTFIKDILELTESNELLCPFRLSQHELWRKLTDEVTDFTQGLKQAYRKISRGKDIIVMEGLGNLNVDKVSTLACYTIADTLEASVVIVLRYSPTLDVAKIVQIGKKLERPWGVIVNLVPKSRIETARQGLTALFKTAGIKVLGILPEVRSLLGVSVGELAEILNGEFLTSPENTDDIVENIMVGAMTIDSGITYFNRKENKAVVVLGERADMQLAALETSTKCLILTNSQKPLPSVISEAQEKHIPIIMVKQNTTEAVAGIEVALAKASIRSARKLEIFSKVLDSYFDFEVLCSELKLRA